MESRQGVFKPREDDYTYDDVKEAITTIDGILLQKFDKSVFRDILSGFKLLIKRLHQKKENEETPICNILLEWLKLYLRAQNALPADNVKLQEQFEKFIPASISYIITALQCTPKDVAQYHFQILDVVMKLLENVAESTLKNVANLEIGFVVILRQIINTVGDFNTQMMAFRVIVKLLKCLNESKQHENLKSLQGCHLQEFIYRAVRVYNFPAGKFEKIARHALNHYNINLANNNVLIYSMRCKSVTIGNNTFYKKLHEDQLWLDLNYCPRTLTFQSRYRPSNKSNYIDVGVTLHIAKFSLNENILSSVLKAPPQFTKTTEQLDSLKTDCRVRFELPDEEVLRLQENQCVIDYYNEAISSNQIFEPQVNTPINPTTSDEHRLELTTDKSNGVAMPNKSFTLTPPNSPSNFSKGPCDNFQRSYNLLIAHSGNLERNKNNSETSEAAAEQETANMEFKKPSLPHYELRKNRAVVMNDSPKSSRTSNDKLTAITEKVKHPIAELSCIQNNGRRFFKNKNDSSDDTYQPSAKKCKTMKKNVNRYRRTKVLTSPTKRKQVNKVKPMNHLSKGDGDPDQAIQEYVENGGIINITNFLNNGNESAAVFNEEQRRTILQNVGRISDGLEVSAKRFFPKNKSATVGQIPNPTVNGDVYEEYESEAEPGRSYRNFETHRPKQEKPKRKRLRKNDNTIKPTAEQTHQQIAHNDENAPSTSRAAAERAAQNKRKRAAVSSAVVNTNAMERHPSKVPKLESKKLQDKTIYSADISIDLTLDADNGIENKSSNGREISKDFEVNSNTGTFFKRIFQQSNAEISSSPSSSVADDYNNDKQSKVGQATSVDNIDNIEEFNEIQECRNDNALDVTSINDAFSSPIHIITNRSNSPALLDNLDKSPQNTITVLTATADINFNQNEIDKNDFFKNKLPKSSSIKSATSKKTNGFNHRKSIRPSQEKFNDCILYHSRSDTESSDESEEESNSVDLETTNFKQLKTPTKFTVERISEKSMSRSTRNSLASTGPTCKITTSITTHKVISRDVFIRNTTNVDESNLNGDEITKNNELVNGTSVISNFPVVDAGANKCVTHYFNDLDLTQQQVTKDTSSLLQTFQENFILKFQDVNKSNSQKDTLDLLIQKTIDLSERIIIEKEKVRLEMENSQKEIAKILCQLNWHWDVMQAQAERFNYFKENMEQLLDTVTSINVEEEINKEFAQNVSTIQNHGNEMRKKEWTNYVNCFTKNLLQNVSMLSAL